jgi:hypothetical protein
VLFLLLCDLKASEDRRRSASNVPPVLLSELAPVLELLEALSAMNQGSFALHAAVRQRRAEKRDHRRPAGAGGAAGASASAAQRSEASRRVESMRAALAEKTRRFEHLLYPSRAPSTSTRDVTQQHNAAFVGLTGFSSAPPPVAPARSAPSSPAVPAAAATPPPSPAKSSVKT